MTVAKIGAAAATMRLAPIVGRRTRCCAKFTLRGDFSLPFSRHKKPKNLAHLLSYVRVTLTWGVAMQGSSYFHRQANTCLRLSASCTDQNLADRFQAMAQVFIAKAADAKVDDEDECLSLSEHTQGRRGGRA
jgi:hypothetical protein